MARVPTEFAVDLDQERQHWLHLVRWLILAAITGAVVGVCTALFLHALNAATAATSVYPNYFVLLPLAMVATVLFVRKVWPSVGKPSTDTVIRSIHEGKPLSLRAGVKSFIAPILTIAFGGSAGKEAPAADVGASVGSLLGRLFKLDRDDQRKLAICGISAGFSAVFGTPIAGAIFGIELLFIGSLLYDVLLPSFIAGMTAWGVAVALGAPFWYHSVPVAVGFSSALLLLVIGAGFLFGLLAVVVIQAVRLAKRVADMGAFSQPIIALQAGALILVLAAIVGTRYLGLGLSDFESFVAGAPAPPFAFALKTLFTVLTFAAGGIGGLVTPTLYIGAAAGSTYASLTHANLSIFAAVGTVALLAGVMSTPIAASILAIELFGPSIAPYAALACVISFFVTGSRSVYKSQVLAVAKSPAHATTRRTRSAQSAPRRSARKQP